jgi:hydroxypyruvate isomerase
MRHPRNPQGPPTRRRAIQQAAGAAAVLGAAALHADRTEAHMPNVEADPDTPVAQNGRVKHSLVHWCYAPYWDVPALIGVAKGLGCKSIELIDPKHLPALKEAGLSCAILGTNMAPYKGFERGFNNPKYRPQVLQATREAIDAAAAFGVPNVIAFTGMAEDIPADAGASNCVAGFKEIAGYAEAKGVTICLEMLNTRASDHPMKGHPGYQGDHVDYCVDILRRVGSPRVKLLFDIYHVQIMDGDLIRRMEQNREFIGHVHTAGNPGRGELDERQEIHYPAVMQALVRIGYDGYVGHEFIPTRDPLAGLRQAVAACDV